MTIPEKKKIEGAFTLLPIEDVFYGEGCVNKLEEVLSRYDIQKALLITGKTLFNETKLVQKVINASEGRIKSVF
ncbi:MAG TPA: hypothetical protein DIT98_08270, partial [Verrucomicrobiales bacterium]|nr:hypothetical protein [Verrucomicrobiales bacterium]